MSILMSQITHPDWTLKLQDWNKWRITYQGGKLFIDAYLKHLSSREDKTDYLERREVTYCPSFAKSGVNEIKDSIYQRMADITRAGGSKSYQEAISGKNGGVDLEGSSMNFFMGCKILPELLTMEKVGIYVDMPPLNGSSLAANANLRPYIYMYKAEDIRAWIVDDSSEPNEFLAILLQEYQYLYDEHTGFPVGITSRFRRVWKDENGIIFACFYDDAGLMTDVDGNRIEEPIELNIDRVPFTLASISESLLTDVADYQIALLNLASTDMSYALKSNFPFYTEQYDPRTQSSHLKPDVDEEKKSQEVNVGVSKGRRYPSLMERPGFINPSSEPLTVSMAKQEQLKEEIRLLLKLTIANLQGPKMASAESKKQDVGTLETGLSYIGLALENTERKIAELWAMYEGNNQIATVIYPETYSLRTEEDRQNEAERLDKLKAKIPSKEFQKAVCKRIARVILGTKVARETIEKIEKEIDAAVTLDTDYLAIQVDTELGLVGLDLASKIRGYPEGEVAKAKEDHAARLARIAESQSQADGVNAPAARGVAIADGNAKKTASDEKTQSRQTTTDPTVTDKTRGQGK